MSRRFKVQLDIYFRDVGIKNLGFGVADSKVNLTVYSFERPNLPQLSIRFR